ncbi:hypothetical protein BIV57_06190 [Mangrovactinospora gilvigrisea]|uniref:SAM-dependent methyltransferase n=1 Tax=Mangrovactinospora gilvigrisea TaxID=1428644 RepID=A0A1J7BHV1_9ACTN|nr:SAM-dependent methyltransferase [Mangrovactinospora gilvigrisea]OIV38263.1 hypothetical protein BIV57_06190 [Mangrovactinospora gilvigrisea]
MTTQKQGSEQDWVPEGVDTSRPSIARCYDWYLGGRHNFAVDREVGEQVLAVEPSSALNARANRAFLQRAVRHLAVERGLRRFVDLGTGIPTAGNVHEVLAECAPEARVLYVDHDPVAVAHSRALLRGSGTATVVQADFRSPRAVLDHPFLKEAVAAGEPVGVLMVAVLHCITDEEDPWGIVAEFRDALPPGSAFAISHATEDGLTSEQARRIEDLYRNSASPLTLRGRAEVERLFAGCELVEPGVAMVTDWRPAASDAPAPDTVFVWCGVGVH